MSGGGRAVASEWVQEIGVLLGTQAEKLPRDERETVIAAFERARGMALPTTIRAGGCLHRDTRRTRRRCGRSQAL